MDNEVDRYGGESEESAAGGAHFIGFELRSQIAQALAADPVIRHATELLSVVLAEFKLAMRSDAPCKIDFAQIQGGFLLGTDAAEVINLLRALLDPEAPCDAATRVRLEAMASASRLIAEAGKLAGNSAHSA